MTDSHIEKSKAQFFLVASAYSLPAAVAATLGVLFYVYIPSLYSEQYGVSLAVVGTVVFVSRVWDAVIDPLVGYLSDRTRHTWGRRKVWIVWSLPLLALTFYLLCNPPTSVAIGYAAVWFSVGAMLYYLFWTTLSIPYEALGTELISGYHARTTLFSIRQGFIVIGTMAAGVIPALMVAADYGGETFRWGAIGAVVALILALSTLLFVAMVKEPLSSSTSTTSPGFTEMLRCARKNRHFITLLTSYTLSGIGASLPATLIVYYVKYVIGVEDPAIYLTAYFAVGFVMLPFWVWLSRRIGKRDAWIYSMLVNTAAFIGVVALGRGDSTAYLILVSLSGIGYGGSLALPAAMQADVLDVEEVERGARREGEFLALWSISSKLAAAAGSGIAFPILSFSGYVPNGVQTPTTVFALTILYAAVPSLCNLLAIRVARGFELTEELHRTIVNRNTFR